ncbi:MAG: hypothetical protein EHM47_09485 [Ignavibacteriales bacterium]|nr:MAG: hypothetical protein EHM47_09485 [Ignavibacteriales bacterium]
MISRKTDLIIYLIALTFLTRLLFTLFFVDLNNLEYHEYGNLALNMHNEKGYSLFYYEKDKLEYRFTPEAAPYISAYMPPGYTFFLYPFFYIDDTATRNFIIIFFQILLSCFSVYLLYKFTLKLFNESAALTASLIAAVFPEFIYASCDIQVIIFYHLFIIAILIFLQKEIEKPDAQYYLFLALLFSVFLYFRSEILIFAGVIFLYFIYKNNYKAAITFITIIILFMLPWQIRNYNTFDEFVPLTTSSGLNFYRGHNPDNIGTWGDSTTDAYLYSIKDEKNFEVKMNKMYFSFAFESIKNEPWKEVINPFIKLFHLYFFNPRFEKVYNIFYLVPWFLMLGFSVYGLIKTYSFRKFKFIYLFIIYTSLVCIIFFVLPRYQTMMKIVLIPFAAFAVNLSAEKIKGKFRKKSERRR